VTTVSNLLRSAHVLAAIVFIGPVTMAVSLFPRYAGQALVEASRRLVGAGPAAMSDGEAPPGAVDDHRSSAEPVTRLLHRISRVYSVLGLAVPVLGLTLAIRMRVLGDVWLLASIVLTVVAAVLLAAVVLPAQHRAMTLLDGEPGDGPASASAVERWVSGAKRLSMSSGIFALLWAVVVVLMVVRPGSTTGA
jgi:hypothetical protein